MIRWIDRQPWITDLKRRVQHYGWRYDYRARHVDLADDLGPIPNALRSILQLPDIVKVFDRSPDQIIINEYRPRQGISAHVDCEPCFGPVIASLSLGGATDMVFRHRSSDERRRVRLEPRGLLILAGEARYDWTHEIPARKSDMVNGVRIARDRRLSLTFRTVNL
ncbi:alpha-ketoglutarate-dependent dioxygenase AlkB [Hyphobacterium indicum]|uniref:alpha-ketoglutarate-dependent dioxygenase AlkB n=1 Tax=Hyphobacterium indicum TaxID=2162714 RepID=UPI001F1A7397|nr:alpha-ketoglutarate-dependent dioxygenase AlkB [Hyphobacterium indicum]